VAEINQPGCLFVGEGVVLKGSFTVPDIASISGKIEGELSAKQIVVELTGSVSGRVSGEVIDVRGEVVEHLTASQALIIRATGKAHGAIHYSEIEIEKGGLIHGDLNILNSSQN
jgi:cytoskeletal protein CcmA (bactofilin family)